MKKIGFTDRELRTVLTHMSQDLFVSDECRYIIDKKIESTIMEDKKMKHFKPKRVVILVAACLLLTGTACFAAGQVKSTVTSGRTGSEYTKLSDLDLVKEKMGLNVIVPAQFTNGYQFSGMSISASTDMDEEGNELGTYNNLSVNYKLDGKSDLILTEEDIAHHTPGRTADQTKQCGSIELSYYTDTYKFVPEDYELTPEDQANSEKDNYYISYGSESVTINQVSYITWQQNGVSFSLMSFDTSLTPDEMLSMAAEMVQ